MQHSLNECDNTIIVNSRVKTKKKISLGLSDKLILVIDNR